MPSGSVARAALPERVIWVRSTGAAPGLPVLDGFPAVGVEGVEVPGVLEAEEAPSKDVSVALVVTEEEVETVKEVEATGKKL